MADGSLDLDPSIIHLPGLDGVIIVDASEVELSVVSATLDTASVGLRLATIDLELVGPKAHNYELVGTPVRVKVQVSAMDRRHGNHVPRYYSIEGRFIGEGKDFVIKHPGLYIRLTGRHAERIIVK